ncbi:MAG: DUF1592 domain-containing protein [Planctomycetales bacterium]
MMTGAGCSLPVRRDPDAVCRMRRMVLRLATVLVAAFALRGGDSAAAAPSRIERLVNEYCVGCHDAPTTSGGLDLTKALAQELERQPDLWETVLRKLRSRQMPPIGELRPDEAEYNAVVDELEFRLDQEALRRPRPGRTQTLRRLNRGEYQNAIRDLLGLEIDAKSLLPPDEASHGFDNVTVGELSPALLDRYITAAQRISRLAVGTLGASPGGETIRIRPDITQEDRADGLPLGTRGGALIRHTFPQAGEYRLQIRLARDRNEHVEGLSEPHDIEVLLDREIAQSFTVEPPPGGQDFSHIDEHLTARFEVSAGPHELGVTFPKNSSSLLETLRQPYNSRFNMHRHPRIAPALYQVTITGPFSPRGPGETPSRRRIFRAQPASADDEDACAGRNLAALMRLAHRRPIDETDLDRIMAFYRDARQEADYEGAIEASLAAILVSREFLFRVEQQPAEMAPGATYRISDLELASRIAFFLWSSLPDDELLEVAARGELRKPEILEAQTRRLLADLRSQSLVHQFADQWLHLRNLEGFTPDGRLYPDFDDNLRQALRQETERHFSEMVRRDQSVLTLLKTDHTWLNERLAKHYGVPHVYGPRWRRVELEPAAQRGGLLRQGSILTVTSYATRTSPVIRGKWILENLLASPPPPPAPDVPSLDDNRVSAELPVRQRLAAHRAQAACASCHNLMDPVGFALEHFDAVGRWRDTEWDQPVDATGGLPDGSRFVGVGGLEDALLRRPELFAGALAEKLLTFALGRGIEPLDGPALRGIVRRAQGADYRFSEIILGIVQSVPFQMRTTQ